MKRIVNAKKAKVNSSDETKTVSINTLCCWLRIELLCKVRGDPLAKRQLKAYYVVARS